jgi:hypothetical protein
MTADTVTLARLLAMAALLAATTEYAEMIKRRVLRQVNARERSALEQYGLHGLVRVFLADSPQSRSRSRTAADPWKAPG